VTDELLADGARRAAHRLLGGTLACALDHDEQLRHDSHRNQ
jgi:hypothetical protein